MKTVLFLVLFCSPLAYAQENISLLSPFDGDTLETKTPLLNWAYLNGITQNDREFYRLILVELKSGQSAEAGIVVNVPLIKMDRYPGTQLFYPFDAPELKEGYWYAWQIQKIANNVLVDKSEAWKFYIPLPEPESPNYYRLKTKNDGYVYHAKDGVIYISFDNNYKAGSFDYSISDNTGKIIGSNAILNPAQDEEHQESSVVKTGHNLFRIDLSSYNLNGEYTLRIVDAKRSTYKLKFKVN